MGRALRIDTEGGYHHVMNRGANRQTVFFCDADRVEFGRLLGVINERFGIEVLAYCLLDNHYHLVLHCPNGGLSEAMHLLGSVFTRHANERVGRDGPLFRGRFHAVPILTEDQLVVTVRYVHRNALDIAGVSDVDGYRWSSHRAYLGYRKAPSFLNRETVLGAFNGSTEVFDEFVRSDLQGGIWLPCEERLAPLLNAAVDSAFDANSVGPNVARTVSILLLDHLEDRSRSVLIGQLAFGSRDGAARAVRRARQRAISEPRLGRAVATALGLMGGHVVPGTT